MLVFKTVVFAQTDIAAQTAWAALQRQPITEATFRKSCDLIQDLGQTNLALAYDLLKAYVPKVQATRNQRWTHILLINWGKGYESLNRLAEAEPIFRQARQNAASNARLYADALTYTVQLYTDWDKPDSVARYLALGDQVARMANDRQNLSLLRTYRALSYQRQGNPKAMQADFDEAIRLASGLADKNALFMAWYNRTNKVLTNPREQIVAYDSLLALTADSSLIRKPRFYDRTTVYFRNPGPTVLYSLVQLNLFLADYDNAGVFADQVYEAIVRPNPRGPVAPFLNAELAFVKTSQGQFQQARALLDSSRRGFGGVEANIPYLTYFLASGRLAEHEGQFAKAANYYRQSLTKGITAGAFSRVPPEVFYARALLHIGQPDKARQVLTPLTRDAIANQFSATGLYYFQALADLHKANGDLPGYSHALDMYHAIRDSLTNLNQYRAVQRVVAQMRLREKEQQIARLNAENVTRAQQFQRERWLYGISLSLAALTMGLLVVWVRNRQIRTRQREALLQSQFEQREQQQRIELMQRVMEAEAGERLSIADQLHNEVSTLLAVATLNLSSALETGHVDAATTPKLQRAQTVLTTLSGTVRDISHRLTPQIIEQQGFKYAIEELIDGINLSARVQFRAIIVGFDSPMPLPFLSDLYRIAQELVHNVLRHAQATEATIEVVEHERHITIIVEDNGIGIDTKAIGDGQGLATIRAKVTLRRGLMDVQRKPEGGTLVLIDGLEVPSK